MAWSSELEAEEDLEEALPSELEAEGEEAAAALGRCSSSPRRRRRH
jgi:hypothetical protein